MIKKILCVITLLLVYLGVFVSCGDSDELELTDPPTEEIPSTSSEGLSFTLNEDGKSYTAAGIGFCKEENIVIDTYNNLPVTRIENHGFTDCSIIKSVTLSDNVEYIGTLAFGGCKNLESISLPDGVINVWGSAFDSPTIKTLKLPASVKYMDKRIFSYQQFNGTIEYGGTVEMWNGIEKHEDWIESFQKVKVVCTDGTVSYN